MSQLRVSQKRLLVYHKAMMSFWNDTMKRLSEFINFTKTYDAFDEEEKGKYTQQDITDTMVTLFLTYAYNIVQNTVQRSGEDMDTFLDQKEKLFFGIDIDAFMNIEGDEEIIDLNEELKKLKNE